MKPSGTRKTWACGGQSERLGERRACWEEGQPLRVSQHRERERDQRDAIVLVMRLGQEGPETRPSVCSLRRRTVGCHPRFGAQRREREFGLRRLRPAAEHGLQRGSPGRKGSGARRGEVKNRCQLDSC